jgi:hypothetical protein
MIQKNGKLRVTLTGGEGPHQSRSICYYYGIVSKNGKGSFHENFTKMGKLVDWVKGGE